ncbi:hypothetical protein JCM8547_001736 [Rhodosporidiobolus lusitaniae]
MLMDQTQGSEMERLWTLLTELSAQLSQNRQQTEELHRRADELKAQAVHSQTGFTLRRFNLDMSQEEFDSELEKMNVALVLENQALQQENRGLSSLLKDYEGTLEAVMGKFRAHAHATQQYHLDLTRHYESLLLSMPVSMPQAAEGAVDPSNPEAPPIDPLHLQLSLAHLASLLRKALRALNGEDPEDSTSPLMQPLSVDGAIDSLSNHLSGLRPPSSAAIGEPASRPRRGSDGEESISGFSSLSNLSLSSSVPGAPPSLPDTAAAESDYDRLLASHHPSTFRTRPTESAGGYISRGATTEPHYIPTTSTSSLVASPPKAGEPVRPRDEFAAKGLGPLDEALQREAEFEALRKENDELRKLLRLAEDPESVHFSPMAKPVEPPSVSGAEPLRI